MTSLDTVAALIERATAGAVPGSAAADPATPLFDLGLDSLSWLRLIDAVESEYGVDLTRTCPDLHTVTTAALREALGCSGRDR